MAKQDDYTRYTIRLPTPLYERVKAAAGEKSVNAEIVEALSLFYPEPKLKAEDLLAEYITLSREALRSGNTQEQRDIAVQRMNEIETQYRDLTGSKI